MLIRLPNCLDYPTAFLGALKRGAIAVPTSTMLTADEVRFVGADSGAVVAVTDRATWAAMHELLEDLPALRDVLLVDGVPTCRAGASGSTTLDPALAAIARWEAAHPTRADDPAYLVYTSGTTGYPKGVLHAHRALLGRQPSSTYWFDFDPAGDRVLHAGKYNWTYVLGHGAHGSALSRPHGDRARGRHRRDVVARAASPGTARRSSSGCRRSTGRSCRRRRTGAATCRRCATA